MDGFAQSLAPLPYHLQLRDVIRAEEPALWDWYASDRHAPGYADAVRFELLKMSYRMDPAAHAELYAAGALAQQRLGLELPLAFYQAQDSTGINAGLCFVPGEAHIVLSGPILALLDPAELAALIGHELAHHRLWSEDAGSLRTTSEVVEALAGQEPAHASLVTTAARLRRFTEIYADRGALQVSGDPLVVIACLVKTTTGLSQVDARAYLRQAEEVLSGATRPDAERTHPETFVRARALQLWHERGPEAEGEIRQLVSGERSLRELDRLEQLELNELTRALIDELLEPSWLRSEAVLAHARRYFPDYERRPKRLARERMADLGDELREYFAHVVLDFIAADSSLDELAIGHGLRCAEQLGLGAAFEKAARKELKLTLKELDRLRERFPALAERARSEVSP